MQYDVYGNEDTINGQNWWRARDEVANGLAETTVIRLYFYAPPGVSVSRFRKLLEN